LALESYPFWGKCFLFISSLLLQIPVTGGNLEVGISPSKSLFFRPFIRFISALLDRLSPPPEVLSILAGVAN